MIHLLPPLDHRCAPCGHSQLVVFRRRFALLPMLLLAVLCTLTCLTTITSVSAMYSTPNGYLLDSDLALPSLNITGALRVKSVDLGLLVQQQQSTINQLQAFITGLQATLGLDANGLIVAGGFF